MSGICKGWVCGLGSASVCWPLVVLLWKPISEIESGPAGGCETCGFALVGVCGFGVSMILGLWDK